MIKILLTVAIVFSVIAKSQSADSFGRNYVTINCNPEYLDQITASTWTWRLVYQDPDTLIWYSAGQDNRSVMNYFKQDPYMYSRKINFSVALFKDGIQVAGTQKDGFTSAGNAYLTLGTLVVPVTVVSQPSSRVGAVGSSTTFSVQAYGGDPLTYQWRKNNVNINGAISSSYTIPSIATSDAGSYTCYISNSAGFKLTSSAALSVNYIITKNADSSKGAITLSPDQVNYTAGQTVSASAVPNPGYIFKNWTGSLSSTSNPLAIIMDGDKSISVSFDKDLSDSDGDGLSNYDEIIVHGSNPNLQDTNNDGISDGVSVGLGYSPLLNFTAIKNYYSANPPTGLYTLQQIMDMNIGRLVLTKNNSNQFILNYDIQQSTDLSNWTVYSAHSVALTNLPADKTFIRVKSKE